MSKSLQMTHSSYPSIEDNCLQTQLFLITPLTVLHSSMPTFIFSHLQNMVFLNYYLQFGMVKVQCCPIMEHSEILNAVTFHVCISNAAQVS